MQSKKWIKLDPFRLPVTIIAIEKGKPVGVCLRVFPSFRNEMLSLTYDNNES